MANPTYVIDSSDTSLRYFDYDTGQWVQASGVDIEAVLDAVGAALTAGNNIDIEVNDANNTITISVEALTSADITGFDEQVRDTIGTALVAGSNITITPNDAGDTITIAATVPESATSWKDPVRVVATSNVPLGGTGTNIDGVSVAVGDRVLLTAQTNPTQNGIYVVAMGGWSRSSDADTVADLVGAAVLVREGNSGKGDVYAQSGNLTTLGSQAVAFSKIAEGNPVYTSDGTTIEAVGGTSFRIAAAAAGDGLSGGSGSPLAVNVGTGLEIASDAVRISAVAAGNGLIGGGATPLHVGEGVGVIVGASNVSIDTSVVVRKAAGALTGNTASEVLTHGLNTRDVAKVTLVNGSSPYDGIDDFYWEATTVNTVTIYAGTGFTLPAGYRWVVMA